jgi:hypothetical protein
LDSIVLEMLIKWLHAHSAHALMDKIAYGIIHHRRGDPSLKPKAIRQVGGDIELATADMNPTFICFAEGNYPWVKTVHQGAE